MSSTRLRLLFLIYVGALAVLTSRCSDMQCNNTPQREWPSPSPSPTPLPSGVFIIPMTPTPTPTPTPEPVKITEPTVMLSKSTGDKQCQTTGGVSLEQMKTQLISKKIPVFEAHTQADGLMHMALCGTSTGTIHVFTIPARLKQRAEKYGFKEFKPKAQNP